MTALYKTLTLILKSALPGMAVQLLLQAVVEETAHKSETHSTMGPFSMLDLSCKSISESSPVGLLRLEED